MSRHESARPLRAAVLGIAVICLGLLGGCGSLMSVDTARDNARIMAQAAGLAPAVASGGEFRLQTFQRGVERGVAQLRVFIEGDGRAWRGRHRPPADPTPTRPIALMLAAADPAAAVLYIARPCQFVDSPGRCDNSLWTSHRYGEAVVNAVNSVIDQVQEAHPGRDLILVGHSGGGVVAALIAARRRDVAALYTLAAPLSVAIWTNALRLTPLVGSLDPASLPPIQARALARHPQWHFLGTADAIVPATVLHHYMDALPAPHRARQVLLDGLDHQCCWQALWPDLLKR